MNRTTTQEAISQAQRFLNLANDVIKEADKDKMIWYGSKITAACKRASMDLTRALAELRKP